MMTAMTIAVTTNMNQDLPLTTSTTNSTTTTTTTIISGCSSNSSTETTLKMEAHEKHHHNDMNDDENDSHDNDDDGSIDSDLGFLELQRDLDWAADSIDILEVEFAADLEALSQGLETAFESFCNHSHNNGHDEKYLDDLLEQSEKDNVTVQAFKADMEARLRQAALENSNKRKQKRRQNIHQPPSPTGVQDELIESYDHFLESLQDNSNRTVPKLPILPQRKVDMRRVSVIADVEIQFKNWFQRVWAVTEDILLNKKKPKAFYPC